MKFATKDVLNISRHTLKYVAALPWEVKSSNLLQIGRKIQTKCIDFTCIHLM